MSTRSDRARRRAAKLRNQRIALIVLGLLVLGAIGYFAWSAMKPETPVTTGETTEMDTSAMTTTASGLKYQDTVVGSETEATTGSTVSVHYTGWLEDGTKFDSSKDRGQPLSFTLGQREVIAGWDEGIVGMKEGGTRILVIPPNLGYGARGFAGAIPPNATLRFEVELLDVQ